MITTSSADYIHKTFGTRPGIATAQPVCPNAGSACHSSLVDVSKHDMFCRTTAYTLSLQQQAFRLRAILTLSAVSYRRQYYNTPSLHAFSSHLHTLVSPSSHLRLPPLSPLLPLPDRVPSSTHIPQPATSHEVVYLANVVDREVSNDRRPAAFHLAPGSTGAYIDRKLSRYGTCLLVPTSSYQLAEYTYHGSVRVNLFARARASSCATL